MNSLARWFYNKIIEQLQSTDGQALICMNGIDDAGVYNDICQALKAYTDKNGISFTAKLSRQKYEIFLKDPDSKSYADTLRNRDWVDFEDKLTYYRNLATTSGRQKYLVLLMGTETVEDKGGLFDFYTLSPQIADKRLKDNYSSLLPDRLHRAGSEDSTFDSAFDRFYQTLFHYVEKDLLRLSKQIDSWETAEYTEEEIWDDMFRSLPLVWKVPVIVDMKPSIGAASKSDQISILAKACQFIQRKRYAKISKKDRKKLIDQFDIYATKEPFNRYAADFPSGQSVSGLDELKQIVVDFASNVYTEKNRQVLLGTDYSIVEDVLKTRLPKSKAKSKVQKIYGDPLTVLITAFLSTATDSACANCTFNNIEFRVSKVSVGLKGVTKDERQAECAEQWRKVCRFAGGIADFLGKEGWQCKDEPIDFACIPAGIFTPSAADSFVELQTVTPSATENTKVAFSVMVKYGEELLISADYEWNIRADEDWLSAFHMLASVDDDMQQSEVPFFIWDKLNDTFQAKSIEEFSQQISRAKFERQNIVPLVQSELGAKHEKYVDELFAFDELGKAFTQFCKTVDTQGFFRAIELNDTGRLFDKYRNAGMLFRAKPKSLERMVYLRCYLNSFLICENMEPIVTNTSVEQCIVPPFHPAMLEKIVDRMAFMRSGMKEWYVKATAKSTSERLPKALSRLMDLSHVHAALDAVYNQRRLMGVEQTYGYFSLYGAYRPTTNFTRMGTMLEKEAIYDDDFNASSFGRASAEAKMIMRVMDNYRTTYGRDGDRFSLVFVNPPDLQIVVAAITGYVNEAKERSKEFGASDVYIDAMFLLPENNRGGRNYLSYWLDNLLDTDSGVHIEAYLQYWKEYENISKSISPNTDIVFFMDALREYGKSQLDFAKATQRKEQKLECRYPMVFRPKVDYDSGASRSVDITQPQFTAATTYTQALSYCFDPEIEYERKIYQTDTISERMQHEIRKSHERAVWVVCVDQALDKACIQSIYGDQRCPVIGFSTGEGSFGQLNLTITTRQTVGEDIKRRCKNRLHAIFTTWKDEELEIASSTCIDRAPRLDGVSVLSALNPSAYEMNNFLAYLMLDSIYERKGDDTVLIRLDSYRHWFDESVSTVTANADDKKIPDFLAIQLSVPHADGADKLHLKATVIECKIAKQANANIHLAKAKTQVKMGCEVLKEHFDPESDDVERRYWFAQLYRAISFGDAGKLRAELLDDLIDGEFTIEWDGAAYGFWFDTPEEGDKTYVDYEGDMPVTIHEIAQGSIQRLLLQKTDADDVEPVQVVGAIEECDEAEAEAPDEIDGLELGEHETEARPAAAEKTGEAPISNAPGKDFKPKPIADSGLADSEQAGDASESAPLEQIRVLIGKDQRKNKVYWEFGHPQLGNRHVLITGSSGQGKTYCIQAMLLELARQGISSVIFDYTDGFMPGQLDEQFEKALSGKITQRFAILDKIPVNPFIRQESELPGNITFQESASNTAGRISEVLSHVYHFGTQQSSAIYTACRDGINRYNDAMDFKKMQMLLEEIGSKEAKSALSAMQQFLDSDVFDTAKGFDWRDITRRDGKITVLQLTGLDRTLQTIITEITLWDAWYSLKKFGKKDLPFVVVLDEAQNLSFKSKSPAESILREGRKYGWSAWFATQFLKGALDSGEISNLQQAAERIYFKPSGEEMSYTASQIADERSEMGNWLSTLKSLQKGCCIVQGDRLRQNGTFGSTAPTLVNVSSIEERL